MAASLLKPLTIELVKATPHCGAEVRGVDLARPLDEAARSTLERALSEHCVLFFRDQSLTPDQQKSLGRRFGELHLHPAFPDILEGHPEIMVIRADENSKRIAGEDWHSDVSCDAEPPLGSILYMQEVPPTGGDTLFASMYAAYEALSAPMRHFLAGLTALHDGEATYRGRYEGMKASEQPYPANEHPVVRTHPVSGRQALFVNRIFTKRIMQVSGRESDALLEMLFRHIETPEFQCRFRWAPGSVAFWDNRCAQHHALWDYYPQRRRGLRVTIQGDRPFFRG
jgi:taurine dioxygenase